MHVTFVNKHVNGHFWCGITKQSTSKPKVEILSWDKIVHWIVTDADDVNNSVPSLHTRQIFSKFRQIMGMAPGTLKKLEFWQKLEDSYPWKIYLSM